MYTIQHNPGRLYNRDKTGVTIVHHKHTKILGLKGNRQISSVQYADRGSLATVVTCLSPTGHFIPPFTCISKKMYETRTDEWNTAWTISRGGYRARFSPIAFLISSDIQSRQNKTLLS